MNLTYGKKALDLLLAYRQDEAKGIPVWKDPGFIGLTIGFFAYILAQYAGISLPGDVQSGLATYIVAVLTKFMGPHVGFYPQKASSNAPKPMEVDHGAA